MQMSDTQVMVACHRIFCGAVLGFKDGVFLVDGFLTLERKTVTQRGIGRTVEVPGFLAVLDTGDDAVEVYEGTSLWDALKAMGHHWIDHKVARLEDETNPSMIPGR